MSKSEKITFPDPQQSTKEGIVAVGGQLQVEWILQAYRQGVFPWPHEGFPLLWFSPDPRGVIDFSELHISASLKKWAKTTPGLHWTVNQDFVAVIRACRAQKRPGQSGTWLTSEMENSYLQLHRLGHAISLEVWQNETLIGGIYAVRSDHYFSAESMFFFKSNASKFALWKLSEYLQQQGHHWLDIQMITPVTHAMGGKYIDRREFLSRI